MVTSRYSIVRCAVVLVSMVVSGYTLAATSIGQAVMVRGTATVDRADGSTQALEQGDKIFLGDTINTSEKSYAVVGFTDGAKVTVRPGSSLNIDQYSAEASNLNLLKGGLRAISGTFGKNNPESYRVKTPVATLGIRGTAFDIRLCGDECAEEEKLLSSSN